MSTAPDPQRACLASRTVALVALFASGCGEERAAVEADRGHDDPVGSCPSPPAGGGDDCVLFDPEAAARTNEEHRQRIELSEEFARRAEEQRTRIDSIVVGAATTPLSADDVIKILRAAGYPDVSAYGRSDVGGGVGFGVDLDVGCVVGQIRGSVVTTEAGGATADAACLVPQGH